MQPFLKKCKCASHHLNPEVGERRVKRRFSRDVARFDHPSNCREDFVLRSISSNLISDEKFSDIFFS
jgi:hypothetical protein